MKYDIFISYSRKDAKIVKIFFDALSAAGYSVWMDVDGIESGDEFKRKIVSAIKDSKLFLFFSSVASNASEWTVKEVNVAVALRKPIIPIKLDNTVYDDSLLLDLSGLDFIECGGNETFSTIQKLMRSLQNKIGSSNSVELKDKVSVKDAEHTQENHYSIPVNTTHAGKSELPKLPLNKKWLVIAAVAVIAFVAVIFGVNWYGDYRAAEAERRQAEIALAEQQAEQQRLEAARLAQEEVARQAKEEADRIAAENKRKAQEEAERKRKEEEERKLKEAANARFSTRTFTVNGVSFKMVAVDGGTFKMGATSEQQNPYANEKPVHNVTLSSYYIGETEVTQALWKAVMGSNPSYFSGSNNPVETVSYEDCITFINKLNSLLSGQLPTGRKFRIPTEAEWEYAARGGNRSLGYQYSGSDNLGSVAWYSSNRDSKTHPVKQKQPNELGLYDMSGNVYEWCHDWYGDYPSSSQSNPKGPSSGSDRVLRGGWSNSSARLCRVANRSNNIPGGRYSFNGLRLAL